MSPPVVCHDRDAAPLFKASIFPIASSIILSATSDVTTGGDLGIPPQLYDWIIIETALRVLNWKMAQMIYVEEDAELTAMVTGQINNLSRISEERKVRFVIKNPVDRRIQGGAD